jgi:hypothetical protein
VSEPRGETSYTLSWVALDKHVLLVAVSSEGAYNGAFVGAVKGEDYRLEAFEVAASGSAVLDTWAEPYFKGFGSGSLKLRRAYNLYIEEDPLMIEPRSLDPSILELRRIDKHVLMVAKSLGINAEGVQTWKAFIGAIKGDDYGAEALGVIKTGTPIGYELAVTCFEDLRLEKWYEPLRVYVDDEDYGPAEEWGRGKPAVPKSEGHPERARG